MIPGTTRTPITVAALCLQLSAAEWQRRRVPQRWQRQAAEQAARLALPRLDRRRGRHRPRHRRLCEVHERGGRIERHPAPGPAGRRSAVRPLAHGVRGRHLRRGAAPVADAGDDVLGIHTHQDGLIHIHPFATRAAGNGAKMSRFFDQTGMEVTDTAIKMPDGKVYKEGETTCDGKPGEVQLAVWEQAVKAPSSEPDRVVTSDIGDVNFDQNYMAMTLAFVPKGGTIKAPSTSGELKTLGECDGENPPPECKTLNTPSSVPAEGDPATATTAPTGGSTQTTTSTKGGRRRDPGRGPGRAGSGPGCDRSPTPPRSRCCRSCTDR